ncbi:MAG: tetratricopeptide repeat protein [Deltaproteobacteria bacterium]|nr:tetratricopeptide repeat protein [Deltaproteobacteria bacterium]
MGITAVSTAYPTLAQAGLALASRSDLAKAKQHYRSGVRHYKRGKFQEAITKFQQSYDLSHRSELLYNIGVCYRYLKNYGEAVRFFKRYLLETPFIKDKDKLETKDNIWFAERQLKKPEKQSADAETPEPGIREDVTFEESENGGRPSRRLPRWSPFAAAGALWALGGLSYFIANGKQNKHKQLVDELIRQGRIEEHAGSLRFADAKSMRLYKGDLNSTDREREIWRDVAIGSLIGGAIAAGVGGFLLWKDAHGNPVKLEPKIGSQTGLLIEYQF